MKPGAGIYDLNAQIAAEIPRLRRYARALTLDQAAADDLVQDCVVRALSKIHLWEYGTNLHAWLFAIMRNEYIDEVRRMMREGTAVPVYEGERSLRCPAEQGKRLELRDLYRALRRLPDDQRTAVLLTSLDGMSYKAVAHIANVPVGTVRARVSRGRAALRRLTGITEAHARSP